MWIGLRVKYLLFLSDVTEILILSTDFRKLLKYEILRKFTQWGPNCTMRTETDIKKANSRFSQFREGA
jgi:hypothetical protein